MDVMMEQHALTFPATRSNTLLVLDADAGRAQSLAHVLLFADYRPVVAATPFQALDRLLRMPYVPLAVLLGQVEEGHKATLSRLLQKLGEQQGTAVQILPIATALPGEFLLRADPAASQAHHVITPAGAAVLTALWNALRVPPGDLLISAPTLALDRLPVIGLTPRVSHEQRSRNIHFRQMLQVARDMMDAHLWAYLMTDVGLGTFAVMDAWPPANDLREVPAEYLTLLNQAVAFSQPENPAAQLRRWGDLATQATLRQRMPSALTQQALKLLPRERVLNTTVKAYAAEMDAIRGEALHVWAQQPDGSYLLAHYSNLFAYGRIARRRPSCHVWLGSLEAALRLVQLEEVYEVQELECSCQTLTGHCIFAIQPM
jgi:hypothetical protein